MNNLLYAQSGGPTAVINTTALGVFETAIKANKFANIYAGLNGIEGILKETFYKIESDCDLSLLKQTPGAAFGSCRHNLTDYKNDDNEYKKIVEIFKKYQITHFLYNGGNDSMETVLKLSNYFKEINFDCLVLGLPKTIDNDLLLTDHTPGYGSASKYIATTFAQIAYDARSYIKGRINIVEIMGRDTGWLTCASSLASLTGYGPDLIYIPEVSFELDEFEMKVSEIYKKNGHCFVAVSEGIKDKDGRFISSLSSNDSFGHAQLGGVAAYLSNYLTEKKYKTRSIELNLPQRSFSTLISKVDSDEAYMCGKYGILKILENETGQMVVIERDDNKNYVTSCKLAPIEKIGGQVRYVDYSYLNEEKNNVSKKFINYALPLIQGEIDIKTKDGLPIFFKLNK